MASVSKRGRTAHAMRVAMNRERSTVAGNFNGNIFF